MKRKLPVALQLFSLRNECAADLEGTLREVKSMGYDGVEFAGLYGKSAGEMKALLGEIGLVPCSAHVSIDEMLADPDGVMECYSDIGCRYIAVPFLAENRRMGGEDYDATLDALRALSEAAARHGMKLMYHNHDFEFAKFGGEYALDVLFSSVPELSVELDCCWAAVGGADPAEYIAKYAARSPVIHLKDFELHGKKPANVMDIMEKGGDAEDSSGRFGFRPCGQGMLDIMRVLDAAEDSAAEWLVVEQDAPSPGRSAMECAAMSCAFLKSVI